MVVWIQEAIMLFVTELNSPAFTNFQTDVMPKTSYAAIIGLQI